MDREERRAKIIINKSGGTASKGGFTYRVTIPNKWVSELGIDADNRYVKLTLEHGKIIISNE